MPANIEQSNPNPIGLPKELKIFAIPGLGVDGRVYRRLSNYLPQLEVIEWILPQEGESLQSYSSRMAQPISQHQGPSLLMGTSFGGVVAQEITQLIKVDGLILLSTFKKGDGKPLIFHLGKKLPIYQLFKGKLRYQLLPFWAPLFGIYDAEEQKLLQEMFMDAPTEHRIWGADKIVSWEGVALKLPFVHFHGKKDRLFRAHQISEAIFLEDAGHFMLVQQAEELSDRILAWMQGELYSSERPG